MRLPEALEFVYSCNNAGTFDLTGMSDNLEWASNSSMAFRDDTNDKNGSVVPLMGRNGSCTEQTWGWVGRNDALAESFEYRCVR